MPGRSRSSGRGARRHLVLLLAVAMCLPSNAMAGWGFFGEILLMGGRAANPGLLDTDQPASLRRGQGQGTSRLTLGARSAWEKSDFKLSYSPYGEFYEDSDLSQLSHALGVTWDHRFTPRVSMKLVEDFIHNPKLPTDPNGAAVGGALVPDTSITTSDFNQSLSFRATQKDSLSWTYRNIMRLYSSDQLLDTLGSAPGMEYSRTFGPHVVVSTGYEFGAFYFRDGLPSDQDQNFRRHRVYGGYAYDFPAGLHVDFDGGFDHLVFTQNDSDSVSKPFVRSSLGWSGTRVHTRLGYEQGLDEGGGVMTSAWLQRVWTEAHVRLTDRASFDLSISGDVRQSLDEVDPAAITLRTLRGGSSFTYRLPRNWALIAAVTHDRQTSTGTTAIPTEMRANRFALGGSWSFQQ